MKTIHLLGRSVDARGADHGLASLVGPAGAPSMRVAGYRAPEVVADPRRLSQKADVYSFGVLLLELVTGREAICADTGCRLTVAVAPVVSEGKVADVVDRRLGDAYDREEAVTVAALALQCITGSSGHRPSMTDVVRVLQEKTSALISAVGPKPASKMVVS